jgi:ABC-type phosphate transport system substrate-binding protein
MNKGNIKQFLSDARAVSPAIATLILIVVAAVAAAGIGILVSHSQGSSKEMLDTKTASVQGKIVSDGSTTVLPVTLLAGPAFMADNPSYTISAVGGGSDIGQLDVFTKKVDIGASSSKWSTSAKTINGITLPPRKDAIIQEAGPSATIWETAIGTGMIVVAANINNGGVTNINITNGANSDVTGNSMNLTFADLTTLYKTGTVTIPSGPTLTAVQRDDPSGTEETFAAWIGSATGNEAMVDGTTKQLVAASTVLGYQGNQGVREAIAATNNTVGFVDIGFSKGQVNGNDKVVAAKMLGNVANTANKGVGGVYDGASKTVTGQTDTTKQKGLARDLFYYSYGVPTGAVKAYLDYIQSSVGQDQVHAAGFFSI